jgi:hypothetical protein
MNFCYDENWISIVYWLKLESCNLIREASMGCNSIKRWILLYRKSISLRILMLHSGSHISFLIVPHTWHESQHTISSFWPFRSLFWKNPSIGIYFYGSLSKKPLCPSAPLLTLSPLCPTTALSTTSSLYCSWPLLISLLFSCPFFLLYKLE